MTAFAHAPETAVIARVLARLPISRLYGRPMGRTLSNTPGFRSPSLGGGEVVEYKGPTASSEGFLRYTTAFACHLRPSWAVFGSIWSDSAGPELCGRAVSSSGQM